MTNIPEFFFVDAIECIQTLRTASDLLGKRVFTNVCFIIPLQVGLNMKLWVLRYLNLRISSS